MNILGMSRRVGLTVGAALALTLVGTGVASASATDCGTKFCISVKGSGLKTTSRTAYLKSGKGMKGYFFVTASHGSSKTWEWDNDPNIAWEKVTFEPDKSYANGTVLCGGVAPTKAELDYAGLGCITVHS